MSQSVESFSQEPIVSAPQAYLYNEYSDDADLQGILQVANQFVQGYLDWFTNTPLAVWTSSNITASLLDWIGANIYNVFRPVISTSFQSTSGSWGTKAYGRSAYGVFSVKKSGTATVANDDIYKRALTWSMYLGDGYQVNITWMKNRIARFLYGANGSDIDLSLTENISIMPMMMFTDTGYGMNVFGLRPAYGMMLMRKGLQIQLNITVPNTPVSQIFSDFLTQGILTMPTQITFSVEISA